MSTIPAKKIECNSDQPDGGNLPVLRGCDQRDQAPFAVANHSEPLRVHVAAADELSTEGVVKSIGDLLCVSGNAVVGNLALRFVGKPLYGQAREEIGVNPMVPGATLDKVGTYCEIRTAG